MVRLVELKERITIYQYIDHFIALLFEMVYFRLCWHQRIVNLMAVVEGIGRHHLYTFGTWEKNLKRLILSKARVGT